MSDPRDPNAPREPYNEFGDKRMDYDRVADARTGAPWGWIAGGAIVALLILVFAFGTGSDRTATNTQSPATTTGQSPRTPAENTGRAPATPPAQNTPRPPAQTPPQ